jgi:hypothetical protein
MAASRHWLKDYSTVRSKSTCTKNKILTSTLYRSLRVPVQYVHTQSVCVCLCVCVCVCVFIIVLVLGSCVSPCLRSLFPVSIIK